MDHVERLPGEDDGDGGADYHSEWAGCGHDGVWVAGCGCECGGNGCSGDGGKSGGEGCGSGCWGGGGGGCYGDVKSEVILMSGGILQLSIGNKGGRLEAWKETGFDVGRHGVLLTLFRFPYAMLFLCIMPRSLLILDIRCRPFEFMILTPQSKPQHTHLHHASALPCQPRLSCTSRTHLPSSQALGLRPAIYRPPTDPHLHPSLP